MNEKKGRERAPRAHGTAAEPRGSAVTATAARVPEVQEKNGKARGKTEEKWSSGG
jgi:hypothetical protein